MSFRIFRTGLPLWDWKTDEEYKKKLEKNAGSNRKSCFIYRVYDAFFAGTPRATEKATGTGGADCEGYREQMLFIAYSALVQLDRSLQQCT